MVFCIYISMLAVVVGIIAETLAGKIIAAAVAAIASAIAQHSYLKLKERVSKNEDMLVKTGKFLIKTSKKVASITENTPEEEGATE